MAWLKDLFKRKEPINSGRQNSDVAYHLGEITRKAQEADNAAASVSHWPVKIEARVSPAKPAPAHETLKGISVVQSPENPLPSKSDEHSTLDALHHAQSQPPAAALQETIKDVMHVSTKHDLRERELLAANYEKMVKKTMPHVRNLQAFAVAEDDHIAVTSRFKLDASGLGSLGFNDHDLFDAHQSKIIRWTMDAQTLLDGINAKLGEAANAASAVGLDSEGLTERLKHISGFEHAVIRNIAGTDNILIDNVREPANAKAFSDDADNYKSKREQSYSHVDDSHSNVIEIERIYQTTVPATSVENALSTLKVEANRQVWRD